MTKILVKIPTRQRPERFRNALLAYVSTSGFVDYLISIDEDDETMINNEIDLHYKSTIKYISQPRVSKVEACNRDVLNHGWDILVLGSDDMIPKQMEWDDVIKRDMKKHFPLLDGCLWYNDGHQTNICTMAIMGRKYYEMFGYIYHPSYKSLWCDNEFTEVAMSLGKMVYSPKCLFEHYHPAWNKKGQWDELYKFNEGLWDEDEANYNKRKLLGFP